MLQIIKFWAWLRASGLNLIIDESELQPQSLEVKARAFRAFKQLVHLSPKHGVQVPKIANIGFFAPKPYLKGVDPDFLFDRKFF